MRRLALATVLVAGAGGAGVAAAADVHPEAQEPARAPALHAVAAEPGHAAWYVFSSGELEINTTSGPAACSGWQHRLEVSLYNPEGHWMRRIHGGAAGYVVLESPYEGRYLVRVAVGDPSCVGLRYDLRTSSNSASSPDAATVDPCPGARANLRRARRKQAAAKKYKRKRLDVPLAANVKQAQADVRTYCHKSV